MYCVFPFCRNIILVIGDRTVYIWTLLKVITSSGARVTVAWVVARSKAGVSVLMSTNEIFVQDLRWLPIHDGLHLHNSVYV